MKSFRLAINNLSKNSRTNYTTAETGRCPLDCLETTEESEDKILELISTPTSHNTAYSKERLIESSNLKMDLKTQKPTHLFQVKKSYIAKKPSELNLVQGKGVRVFAFYGDGTCFAQNEESGETGHCNLSFLEERDSSIESQVASVVNRSLETTTLQAISMDPTDNVVSNEILVSRSIEAKSATETTSSRFLKTKDKVERDANSRSLQSVSRSIDLHVSLETANKKDSECPIVSRTIEVEETLENNASKSRGYRKESNASSSVISHSIEKKLDKEITNEIQDMFELYYRVICNKKANNPNELNLNVDDFVRVSARFENGCCFA